MSKHEEYKPTQPKAHFHSNFLTKKFITKAQSIPRTQQGTNKHSVYNPYGQMKIQNKQLLPFVQNVKIFL